MTKYKVGDMVRGNPNDRYTNTLELGGLVGEITYIDERAVRNPVDDPLFYGVKFTRKWGDTVEYWLGDDQLLPFKEDKK